MLHGRGADARDILGLVPDLNVDDYAILAPQATNFTWYPYSFMEKPEQNEPWLSSALELLQEIIHDISEQGIPAENTYFLGFSQGACLSLEYVTRHAHRYGGVAAFTGGLIGDRIYRENYSGDFNGMPVFISTGDPDPHIPLERTHESARILQEMHAEVNLQVYSGRPHTVSTDEIQRVNQLIF
ncbi:MAG: alpha/beta hydrolase [Bacteroidota bacterium]